MRKEVSAVVESPNKMVLKKFDIPSIKTNDMLLRVERVGICGSDPHFYKGTRKIAAYPLIMGHEMVGYLDKIGDEASKIYNVKIGDRVTVEPYINCGHCKYCLTGYYQLCKERKSYGVNISCDTPPHLWGAYGEYMFIAPGSKVHKISKEIPAEAACLSSVIGNGVRWVITKGGLSIGETIVIMGPGAQGIASTIVAKEAGAGCIILLGTNTDSKRLKLGENFGAITINVEKENPVEVVRNITNGDMADVVVECSGSSLALKLGLDLLKPLGRYVLAGRNDNKENCLDTNKIVVNELKVYGGYGQSWDVERAVSIINSNRYPIENMVTHVFPLEEAETAIKFFINNPQETIRVALDPNQEK